MFSAASERSTAAGWITVTCAPREQDVGRRDASRHTLLGAAKHDRNRVLRRAPQPTVEEHADQAEKIRVDAKSGQGSGEHGDRDPLRCVECTLRLEIMNHNVSDNSQCKS